MRPGGANNGRNWLPKDSPELVNIHDFIDPKLSRAVPYGVYDITNNFGWVSVGTDPTPPALPSMRSADGGGSNGYRVRLWKVELQKLAASSSFP